MSEQKQQIWRWSVIGAISIIVWWLVVSVALSNFIFANVGEITLFFISVIVEFIFLFQIPATLTEHYTGSLKCLGFTKGNPGQILTIGLRTGLLLYLLAIVISVLVSLLIPGERTSQDVVRLIIENNDPLVLFGMVLGSIVLGPLCEEVFFRGILFTALRGKLSKWPASLITSAIFAALHFNWWVMIPIFVISLILNHTFEKYHNIWINILAHAFWNAITVIILLMGRGML